MPATTAHLSVTQPHLAAEHRRRLRPPPYRPPTQAAATIASAVTSRNGAGVDADTQLWSLARDPNTILRGIPVVGYGGAIPGSRPDRSRELRDLDNVLSFRAIAEGWLAASAAATSHPIGVVRP